MYWYISIDSNLFYHTNVFPLSFFSGRCTAEQSPGSLLWKVLHTEAGKRGNWSIAYCSNYTWTRGYKENFGKLIFRHKDKEQLILSISFSIAKLLSRAGRTLHEIQSHLDREGASDLVVELVIKSVHSPSIFVEAIELGIALLEGGNPIIQKSVFNKLMGGDLSQSFFKVYY